MISVYQHKWFGLLALVFSLTLTSGLYAQLIVTSPVNNQVLQRDSLGFANLQISGYSLFPYQKIQGKLIPLTGNGNPVVLAEFDAAQLSQGFLHTTARLPTGWYKLTLTGHSSNGFIDSVSVPRVGVGEVFLVAGNSNAMGLPDLGAKSATDHVITFNATNKILDKDNITVAPDFPMPAPLFSPVEAKSALFPSGETSWYWGELGDMLSERLHTPVLFLNAAWAAANSENYQDGAMGKDAYNMYVGKNWPNRQPYSNIKNTLRYFHSWLGIRAVLWAHGENDAQHGFTEDAYFNNIKTLIELSRRDAGYAAPWILARSSAGEAYPKPYLPIINAQNRLFALKNFQAYLGPNLDSIQMPRPKHGHFENIAGGIQGLTLAATAWDRVLTDSLLRTVVPVQPVLWILTGVTPSEVKPGMPFSLPYTISGHPTQTLRVHAELLDEANGFVDTVGTGLQSPLQIVLPGNLKSGKYKLRITASSPVLPGSISNTFYVNPFALDNQYVNHISARKENNEIYITWLLAAHPQLKSMVLQKTTNGETYTDIGHFEAEANEDNSRIYTFTDPNTGESGIFYRVLLELQNGKKSYSPITTVFQEGAPPHFLIFPNPVTSQRFHLRSDADHLIYYCKLFDLMGREQSLLTNDREMTGVTTVRPASALPAGNYILHITSNAGTQAQLVLIR